jgi:hypothetical protein
MTTTPPIGIHSLEYKYLAVPRREHHATPGYGMSAIH